MSGGWRPERDGVIVLDKSAGFTSQDAVSKARRATGIKKIGHTGTLDKFATGVLPLMVGSCTRLSRFVVEGRKRYRAVFSFGTETDTLDPEGREVRRAEAPDLAALQSVIPSFRGRIMQAPPEYSAIHLNGKRAYELARAGQMPEMAERPIDIYSLEMREYSEDGRAVFEIECSKGCYVRSLARDIARACGSAAYVSALRREATGGFVLEDAVGMDSLGPESVIPFDPALAAKAGLGCLFLAEGRMDDFMNGKKLERAFFSPAADQDAPICAVFAEGGGFRGVVSSKGGRLSYEMVAGRQP